MPRSTATLVWQVSPALLADQVGDMRGRFYDVLEWEMQSAADEVLMWMVANHPWTNRTFQAENELRADAVNGGEQVILENSAPHGIYLEFKHGGRWGVIRPALAAAAPIFRAAMESTLDQVING